MGLAFILLVGIGTLFIPMPAWLSGVISCLVLIGGLLMVGVAALAWYWDSHMMASRVSDDIALGMTGLALVVSRALWLWRTLSGGGFDDLVELD